MKSFLLVKSQSQTSTDRRRSLSVSLRLLKGKKWRTVKRKIKHVPNIAENENLRSQSSHLSLYKLKNNAANHSFSYLSYPRIARKTTSTNRRRREDWVTSSS